MQLAMARAAYALLHRTLAPFRRCTGVQLETRSFLVSVVSLYISSLSILPLDLVSLLSVGLCHFRGPWPEETYNEVIGIAGSHEHHVFSPCTAQ